MLMYDGGYCNMDPRGRFYPYLYQVIDIGTGLYLGRATRTKETLPDFCECRVSYPTSTSIPRVDG